MVADAQKHPAQLDVNGVSGTRTANIPATSPQSTFALGDFSIDEYRPLKVAVIGAGFSGVLAGIRFRQHIPNVSVTVYEKNAGVGGTWYSNRYPGLACDIPSHSYQYTFEPWTDWSAFYAPGLEIRAYIERVVDKYKLRPLIKLQHELVQARYDDPSGKWHIRIRRPKAPPPNEGMEGGEFEEFEDVVDILFMGIGGLSRWTWPKIDGLQDFQGKRIHSAKWDVKGETWQEGVRDWGDKKVAVIGVGSSAIQIVSALQPYVGKLVNYVRGKTWISTTFAGSSLSRFAEEENYTFTEEDKAKFKDHAFYKAFRYELECEINSAYSATLRGSAMQNAATIAFRENMIKRLEKKAWIADHLIPTFPVACRRLTPGPGYLEALCQDNVDFVPTHIRRVTSKGIETIDSKHEDFDIIICATGYDTTWQLPFPVIGRNGLTLNEKWSPHPTTYLASCVDSFPNCFFSLGPNSAVGSGSLLAVIEGLVDFAVKVTKKMQRERLKSAEVKPEAVKDFDEYLEHYFPTSVFSTKCRSWYKMGKEEGRVVALWPGSCMHALRALEHPRWEDFTFEQDDNTKNRFFWLGDGSTYVEKRSEGEGAFYLLDERVDVPPVPEED